MSTRRARIKAVAALPPRRKNVDNDAKNKQNAQKQPSEKRPPTPKTSNSKEEEINSPTPKNVEKSPIPKTMRSPPPLIPISSSPLLAECASTPKTPKEPITVNTTPPNVKKKTDSPHSKKVSVITSNFTFDVFTSPPPKNAPEKQPSLSAKAGGHEQSDEGETNSSDRQNTQEPHILNVQEKENTEGMDKDTDIRVETPLAFNRERMSDIPDGKF